MNQLKVLQYAQAAAMDKWWLYDGLADKFVGERAGEMARNMANEVMNDVKEIGVMIDAEEKRLRAEAEKQRKQEQAVKAQQAQQAQQPERPTAGRIVDDGMKWTVAVRYKDGSETVSRFSHEDIARKAYETIRMLDRGVTKSNLSRMTLTHKNTVVKAYERD